MSRMLKIQATGISMYPLIAPGMTLVLQQSSPGSIRVGDVIASPLLRKEDINNKMLLFKTHRVIWRFNLSVLITKGDNNKRIDDMRDIELHRIYKLIKIVHDGKYIEFSCLSMQMLKVILLVYSYLSFFIPFSFLRGRSMLVAFFYRLQV